MSFGKWLSAVLLAFGCASSAASAETGEGMVQVDVANVRQGAGAQYDVIGTLKQGEPVSILGQDGSWYEIQAGSLHGFVQFRLIRILAPKPEAPPTESPPTEIPEIPRYQFSLGISIDEQYFLQKYAETVARKIREGLGRRGFTDNVFDGASYDDLGFGFWTAQEASTFELIIPMSEDSLMAQSFPTAVQSGYAWGAKPSFAIRSLVQVVREAYLAAEGEMAADDNRLFLSRRFAAITQVTYVNRRGEMLAFAQPFDATRSDSSVLPLFVFFGHNEESVNLNPKGELIELLPEAGGSIVEFLKRPFPRGFRLH